MKKIETSDIKKLELIQINKTMTDINNNSIKLTTTLASSSSTKLFNNNESSTINSNDLSSNPLSTKSTTKSSLLISVTDHALPSAVPTSSTSNISKIYSNKSIKVDELSAPFEGLKINNTNNATNTSSESLKLKNVINENSSNNLPNEVLVTENKTLSTDNSLNNRSINFINLNNNNVETDSNNQLNTSDTEYSNDEINYDDSDELLNDDNQSSSNSINDPG